MPKEKIEGFIKNYDLIQEDYRVEDLLDFSEDIVTFTNKINSIEKSSIIGLVGKFGCGKSTMLYQIQKKNNSSIKWINFDAWKYPDRKDLWEGFVLDFADQLGILDKIQKIIDGKGTTNKTLDVIGDVSSAPLLNLIPIKSFLDIFKSSPATRVFEIQKILQEIVNSQKKKIAIVIEDIDRSGDAGIYFLETLKQFLRNNKFKRQIIVIVPIGDENYRNKKSNDSYLKCLDFIEFFRPEFKGVQNFINAVISDETEQNKDYFPSKQQIICTEHEKNQFVSICNELFKQPNMTIRLLKIILREADITYKCQIKDMRAPDWRVTFCFEASKHIYTESDMKLPYDQLFSQNKVIPHNSIFASFLFMIMRNDDSIYEIVGANGENRLINVPLDIKLITRGIAEGIKGHPSIPWSWEMPGKKHKYFCCDFYLNY